MLIVSVLRRAAARAPNKPALIIGGRSMDYQELNGRSWDIATRLLTAGVAPGDRVALHMHNSLDLAVAYFACFQAGAVAVPINTRMKAAEIAYVLDHSEASLYLGQPELFTEIAELPAGFPAVRQWVTELHKIDALASSPLARELPTVAAEQTAAILYTSGSTARPKGVIHTHHSLSYIGRGFGITWGDVVVPMTPLVHVAALAALLASFEATATVATLAQFDPYAVLDAVARLQATFLWGTPVLYNALIAAQTTWPRDVGSIRRCLAGGDVVPLALKTEFAQCFGRPLRELLGSTENGLIAVNESDIPSQADSFGRASLSGRGLPRLRRHALFQAG